MNEIDQIRNGQMAIEHTGTLKTLNKCLKHCFPKDKVSVDGNFRFYFATINGFWGCYDKTTYATITDIELLKIIDNF